MKTIRTISAIACLLLCSIMAQAQNTGSIKGVVRDANTGETLPGAHVYVKTGQNMIGVASDLNGEFVLKPLAAGIYDVNFSYTGYGPLTITSLIVHADQITFLDDVVMTPGILKGEFKVFADPLINKNGGVDKIMRAKDIEDLPVKNNVVQIMAAMSSDILAADNGRDFSFRGARTGDATFIVDGMIIRGGDPSLPGGSISSIVVYSGGIPAKYGDTTGGVVVIQTKSYFEWEAERRMRSASM